MEGPLGVSAAHVRVGVSLGAGEHGITMADVMSGLNEFMARLLNIMRLMIIVLPIVHQSWYIHSVDFGTWLVRLCGLTAFAVIVIFIFAPEQLFNGMGLRHWREAFERIYPEAKNWTGGILAMGKMEERSSLSPLWVGPKSANHLDGARVRLKMQGTEKYVGLTPDGWAVSCDESFAAMVTLHEVAAKSGEADPDTYKLQVDDPLAKWDGAWLSFSTMNQLRLGGWFGAYRGEHNAGPYKLVIDSSCPPGSCKMLSAWPHLSPVCLRYCTGFYLAEQLFGTNTFIGHAPDRDAALFQLIPDPPVQPEKGGGK